MVATDQSRSIAFAPLLQSSLTFGALSGSSGLIIGSVYGVLRSTHPVIFAVASGIQWFALGTTSWAFRSILISARPDSHTQASTLAGAICGGGIAAATRKPARIVPGSVMFGLFGFLGQRGYEMIGAARLASSRYPLDGQTLLKRLAQSRWSPMKPLSDEEYEGILNEKLVVVDAEIAILDESLDTLRARGSGTKN